MKSSVNILGTEYTIETDDTLDKTDCDGLCKEYDKAISIRSVGSMLCDCDSIQFPKMLKAFEEVGCL